MRELCVAVVGQVDHGKSTLVGRLLQAAGALSVERRAEAAAAGGSRGRPGDWAMVTDQLREERDQQKTLDWAWARLEVGGRLVSLVDTPGHEDLVAAVLSGVSVADAAIWVLDAQQYMPADSGLHLAGLRLLGIRDVLVVISKMDLVGYSHRRFAQVRAQATRRLAEYGLTPVLFVPVSAVANQNIAVPSGDMPWHHGESLLESLGRLRPRTEPLEDGACFVIQRTLNISGRLVCLGRVESGCIEVGMRLHCVGGSAVVAVREVLTNWPGQQACAAQAIALVMDGHAPARGQVWAEAAAGLQSVREARLEIIWLGDEPLRDGRDLRLEMGPQWAHVQIGQVDGGILEAYRSGMAAVTLDRPLVVDRAERRLRLSRVVLHDGRRYCAVAAVCGRAL